MSNTAMKQKSIRLEPGQIAALESEATRIKKKTRMKCDIATLVRLAVDDFIAARKRHSAKNPQEAAA